MPSPQEMTAYLGSILSSISAELAVELPWWATVVFFCVVRFVDIVKPWPCRGLQALPGGRGVVADDFVANLYSLAVNWAIAAMLLRGAA